MNSVSCTGAVAFAFLRGAFALALAFDLDDALAFVERDLDFEAFLADEALLGLAFLAVADV